MGLETLPVTDMVRSICGCVYLGTRPGDGTGLLFITEGTSDLTTALKDPLLPQIKGSTRSPQ